MESDTPKSLPHGSGPQRPWWTAFLLSSLVFAFGAIVGAAIAGHFILSHHADAARKPMVQADRMTRQMQRDLHLSDEQREAVHEILQRHHEQLAAIRRETEPQVRATLDSMRSEIEKKLTPEQAEKWRDQFERMRERMRRPNERGEPNHRKPEGREHPEQRFEKADGNKDGMLDLQEMRSFAPRMNEDRFRTIDTDENGLLSPEELRDHRAHPSREKNPPPPV